MSLTKASEPISGNKLLQLPATFAWKFDPGYVSAIECSGDIDGDGRDEFIVSTVQETSAVACISVVSHLQPSDLDPGWSQLQQPMLVVQWSSPTGIPNWTYPPAAPPQSCSNFSFYSADLDGDGIQEIIAFFPGFSGAPASLGVLKWSKNSLNCVWQTIGSIPGSGGSQPWYLGGELQVYTAHNLDGQGADMLLVVQTGLTVGVLKWNAGALSCLWKAEGSIAGLGGFPRWTFTAIDQFYCADVDGDKRAEIVILAPSYANNTGQPNPAMAVLRWFDDALHVIWQVSSAAGNAPPYVANSQQVFVGDLDGTGTIKLIVLMTAFKGMAVLEWQNDSLNCIWQCGWLVPGAFGVQDWAINPGSSLGRSDSFYLANLDATGDALFIVQAASEGIGAVLKWQNGGIFCVWQGVPNGWSLSIYHEHYPARLGSPGDSILAFAPGGSIGLITWSQGNLDCTFQSRYYVPMWNLSFLVGLPPTPFTAFSGTQLQLYQQICEDLAPQALGSDGETGDIRYQYANLTNAEMFSGWATQIKDMTPIQGYSQADWDAVALTISAEAGWVGIMYGFSVDMTGLALAINIKQDQDLNHCFGNLTLDPFTATNPLPYWAGAVIDAALWGLAATPLGIAAQVGLAVAASLFGSFTGQPSSGDQPTTVVEYRDFKTTVDALFSDALSGTFLDLQSVVTDPVKLRVAGRLAEGAWYWGITDNTTVAANGTNQNRIMFYQMLMAVEFSLFVWVNSEYNYPVHRWLDGQNAREMTQIDAPSHAYWSIPNTDGTYTVSLLAQGTIDEGGAGVKLVAFPIQELMTDLFTNLLVQPSDITFQRFGWDKIANPPNNDMWS